MYQARRAPEASGLMVSRSAFGTSKERPENGRPEEAIILVQSYDLIHADVRGTSEREKQSQSEGQREGGARQELTRILVLVVVPTHGKAWSLAQLLLTVSYTVTDTRPRHSPHATYGRAPALLSSVLFLASGLRSEDSP